MSEIVRDKSALITRSASNKLMNTNAATFRPSLKISV